MKKFYFRYMTTMFLLAITANSDSQAWGQLISLGYTPEECNLERIKAVN